MSRPVRIVHWSELPLGAPGRALVEASAGTGKTWTIAVLYLRLLLEPAQARGVEQVVVTTFTDAAAQELRERLRARLRQALALAELAEQGALPAGDAARPDDEAWLATRWTDAGTQHEDRRRLRLALADFDRAPVGTLHGLCQRILVEHPFESGSRFEPGEPTSGLALAEELGRDAWRVLHHGDGLAHGLALDELKLSSFSQQLRQLMAPGVQLVVEDLARLRGRLPKAWPTQLRELADAKASYQSRKTALANALRALADLVEGVTDTLGEASIKHLVNRDVEDQVKPEQVATYAAHPALATLATWLPHLLAALTSGTVHFWQQQVAQAQAWRDERLAARGQVTFDEMIRRAHAAILRNPRLADALFDAWPVALVDEFQDTDAQQYGILDRLYRNDAGEARGRLVMIGDPKQAIYGFRGGDIHAYRRARADADHVLVLDTNHRSSRHYVEAVNQWYAAGGASLGRSGADDVCYQPVLASPRRDDRPYSVAGVVITAPLQIHFNPHDPGSQPRRRREALTGCANQIAAMLASNQHRIGDVALAPGDLAVLLPTNRDIASLRTLLQARGVPCVGGARDSVFAGDMAFELHLVLSAVMAEDDESALRAALLTRLWGFDLAALAALDVEAAAWSGISVQLNVLRRCWTNEGVLAVVQQLASTAAPRLLASPGGERELTDLRHLGELLQQRAERGGGARELLSWLCDQRRDEGDADSADARQPRLESDARRVQLMTLHRSKGLEFGVVFLPLMWAHEGNRTTRPYLVPMAAGGRRAAFDEAAKALAKAEGQDERFRTLYVALTRAIHACHVYALPPDRPQSANSEKPKSDPDRSPLDAMVANLGAARMPNVLWSEAGWPQRFTALPPMPEPRVARVAHAEPAATPLRQRLSFSTLVSGHRAAATEEAAADDERAVGDAFDPPALEEAPHPELTALASVRGTAFGNALHSVFEDRRHDQPLLAQHKLLRERLGEYGVDPREGSLEALVPAIARRMDGALAAELLPGLRLVDVPVQKQRAEMAFHFALDHARLSRLRAACSAHGDPHLVPPLAIESLRGLMTGKIDLVFEHAGVFHVLDYKGNWLGEHVADYAGASLRAAMDHSHYRLQALVYTLAVHRFLRQRVPDYSYARHLGPYVYLFVRGAGLAPGAGVFAERFPEPLVLAADAAFAGHADAGADA